MRRRGASRGLRSSTGWTRAACPRGRARGTGRLGGHGAQLSTGAGGGPGPGILGLRAECLGNCHARRQTPQVARHPTGDGPAGLGGQPGCRRHLPLLKNSLQAAASLATWATRPSKGSFGPTQATCGGGRSWQAGGSPSVIQPRGPPQPLSPEPARLSGVSPPAAPQPGQ